jgi:aspartate aminotransferase
MLDEFNKRRLYLINELNKIKGIQANLPEGTFYTFCKIERPSYEFAEFLLDKAKVAVLPGKAFGYEGYIRMSFSLPIEEIKEGIKRIKSVLTS